MKKLIIGIMTLIGLISCAPQPPNSLSQLTGHYVDQRWEQPTDYAENYALDTGRGVTWYYTPNSRIVFAPHRMYRYGDTVCRPFTRSIRTEYGDVAIERGHACKDDNGDWEEVGE